MYQQLLSLMHQLLSLLPSIPWPSVTILAAVLLSWLSIVRAYRWKRYNYIHRVYGPKYKAGTLTLEDAQEIVHIITQYEMPVIMQYALTFALFKPYAIPSMSKILNSTKEFQSSDSISKRYSDTFILINTWLQCPISGFMQGNKPLQDPRANLAIARTNFLHSKYRIKNDDYIFTLSLWIFEPERWAANYGWRSLSPLEVHAFFILWLEIARRMNIKDVPETEEALKEWVEDYESKYMVPDPMNHSVALLTTKELIWQVPDVLGLRNFARKLSIAMLEDRFRIAMMYPEQPWYIGTFLYVVIKFLAWQVRYFHLPARTVYGPVEPSMPKFKEGDEPLMHPSQSPSKPWYKPEPRSLGERITTWLLIKVGKYDVMPSAKYKSGGYRLDTIGPLKFERSGREEVYRMAEQLQGCPIGNIWKTPPKS